MDRVSGGLACQLRNGLTGARLAVQLYLQENAGALDGSAPARDPAALEVALRQLTLLETNLKRFLDLGRGGVQKRSACSLRALVGEAVRLLHPKCRHTGIALHWQPPEGDGPLQGDPGQLGQLILNVLGNAI